jgi:exopolyphosphatase/guanosine-5'-triphosphate,3'-diphosphate pyrophosphatase
MGSVTMPLPESVAAVDLGSHSFHLLVARPSAGELVVLDRLREQVQLAAGLNRARRLGREAQQIALACLRRFGQRLQHMPHEVVRAVGTNTLRTAKNAREFLKEAEEALGHPIETISGREEARLIYLGVAHSLANPASRRLVLDIGGGSTEVIIGEAFEPRQMESLYLGCVTVSRKYFEDGVITREAWRRAELAALQEFEPLQRRFRRLGWDQAVGASGTVRSVATVALEEGWTQNGITLKSLKRLRDAILQAGHVDKLRLAGLSPDRRPVFPGGAVLLHAAFEALGIESMQPADGALREGLLYDLLGRIETEDVRSRSVAALADRFHADRKQVKRVKDAAGRCLKQVGEAWHLTSDTAVRMLGWAAQLHEIGLDIAHQQYHKHGEYIVANSDLFGFTLQEQQVLATLVRAHRRKLPADLIRELPHQWVRPTERLAVLLRLAVILNRSRSPNPLPDLAIEAEKRTLRVKFADQWLDQHPLTRTDLEQEKEWLAAADYSLEFS